MLELRADRGLEGDDPHALRVDAVEHPADDAILPRRVDALEDEEDRARRLRVQQVLQVIDPVAQRCRPLPGVCLLEPDLVPRVALGQPGGLSRRNGRSSSTPGLYASRVVRTPLPGQRRTSSSSELEVSGET